MIAFGVFSLGCFLYPAISNQINEHYNESTINEYNRNVNTSSDSEIHAELQMAAQYNKVIATDFFDGGNEEYEKILNDYFDILDVDDGIWERLKSHPSRSSCLSITGKVKMY